LHPDVVLTGQFKDSDKRADVNSIMREIEDARQEALMRRFEPEN